MLAYQIAPRTQTDAAEPGTLSAQAYTALKAERLTREHLESGLDARLAILAAAATGRDA